MRPPVPPAVAAVLRASLERRVDGRAAPAAPAAPAAAQQRLALRAPVASRLGAAAVLQQEPELRALPAAVGQRRPLARAVQVGP